jgi:hypothetical protein
MTLLDSSRVIQDAHCFDFFAGVGLDGVVFAPNIVILGGVLGGVVGLVGDGVFAVSLIVLGGLVDSVAFSFSALGGVVGNFIAAAFSVIKDVSDACGDDAGVASLLAMSCA